MGYHVGVDIGGTFTDAVAIGDDGSLRTAKALTTPGSLAEGVLAALRGLQVEVDEIDSFIHGTTAGLNAFLERRGARVALITTSGFRDVYEIGRANRSEIYDLRYRPPVPLIPRRDIYEVVERLAADGAVITALDEDAVRTLAKSLKGEVDAVAVALLHSYKNPVHEEAIARLFGEVAPSVAVICSNDIAPEWREYERTSTTAISAYIAPIVREYLRVLEDALKARGLKCDLRVMQSNGGVMTVERARERAVQTLFSGPVGGTMAGVAVASELGFERMLCVDMGGTSFDVSLVVDGSADIESQSELEGHPLLAPSVALHTIGAGGGSVGHVVAGALRVGPRSAGAVPGPACYGNGGVEPTVTDANLLLGRLPDVALLGGSLKLDKAAAVAATQTVGEALGLSVESTALGIIAVADAAMANAIREITVSRGIDPREFGLLAFGGAGPLHAVSIAEELELEKVIIPASPGVLSAWGMVHTDLRHDFVQTFFHLVDQLDPMVLDSALEAMLYRARETLLSDGVQESEIVSVPSLDIRYLGQEYTLNIDFGAEEPATEVLTVLHERFDAAHLERFGHNNPDEQIEVIALRMVARGLTERRSMAALVPVSSMVELGRQNVRFHDETHETVVYDRASIVPGTALNGPLILLEAGCTVLVPPKWMVTSSANGHLILERVSE
ncbi:N-methylhydantoinase A [Rhodoglobus vestalii]|uniref:N-methylhydantoinase A n=1 Tax=Rhodoglobus vestalii TaxID=193384 RepID=A0A8H2PYL7_9MICO|nr:hydantoinase/oxoprolinase family protein [Rhodoglobus vestalii]TQO19853.1 N-methylhydantoinase A [Rhodoglobus vestalii]